MPMDRVKKLAMYPAAFHTVFTAPYEGQKILLWASPDEAEVKREARRFRSFLKALRTYPSHPTGIRAARWTARTLLKQDTFGSWDLWIILSERDTRNILDILQAPMDFQNLLDKG